MCMSKPSSTKLKRVCKDLKNTAILTKSTTPGKPELTFVHTSVCNKSLGESVTAFTLAGLLKAPKVVSIDADIAFVNAGDKIRIPITELILCAASGNLVRLKKQRDWLVLNAVLLPPFLMEAAILDSKKAA